MKIEELKPGQTICERCEGNQYDPAPMKMTYMDYTCGPRTCIACNGAGYRDFAEEMDSFDRMNR